MKINFRSLFTGIFLLSFLVGSIVVVREVKATQYRDAGYIEKLSGKVEGPDSAKIKIIEYTDFGCPACLFSQKTLADFFETYPNQIQIEFRHFPLGSHSRSRIAHKASECANIQNRFWQYHNKLFSNQREWLKADAALNPFLNYASELELDLNKFAVCMADEEISEKVSREKESGKKMGVNATPTFFIGGKHFIGYKELKEGGEVLIREILGLKLLPIKKSKAEEPKK